MRIVMPLLALAFSSMALAAPPASLPAAIYSDPPHDTAHPASMAVLHVKSGDAQINAVVYQPAGAGPHPTLLICHGLPGNEKNLDLAQAVRRAGWNAVTFNYRGSWGSGGTFRFAQNPQDAAAVLAYLRAHASELGVDTRHIAITGHSMGGWVAAITAAREPDLIGAALISAADMTSIGAMPTDQRVALMADNMEALAGVTAESMSADAAALDAKNDSFSAAAPKLARLSLLVLTSDDGLAPQSEALAAAVKAGGGKRVSVMHEATDHGWSDRRIALQAAVLNWLKTLQ